MKTVGFLGGYDKMDLIMYVARILTLDYKKVLVIDTTVSQKTKYIVPAIQPTKAYVTDFEGFDVAIGFNNMDEIKKYLGFGNRDLNYDVALIDIDSPEAAINFKIADNKKNCFVTAFDLYSLRKGISILKAFDEPIKLQKVLFSKDFLKEENEYLEYLALGYKVKWEKNMINFPIDLGTYSVIVENQIVTRISIKGINEHYKESLIYLMQMVFDDIISSGDLKRAIKNMEREG